MDANIFKYKIMCFIINFYDYVCWDIFSTVNLNNYKSRLCCGPARCLTPTAHGCAFATCSSLGVLRTAHGPDQAPPSVIYFGRMVFIASRDLILTLFRATIPARHSRCTRNMWKRVLIRWSTVEGSFAVDVP